MRMPRASRRSVSAVSTGTASMYPNAYALAIKPACAALRCHNGIRCCAMIAGMTTWGSRLQTCATHMAVTSVLPCSGIAAALEPRTGDGRFPPQPTTDGHSSRCATVWAATNAGTSIGAMPANVSDSERAIVTAGLANEVEAVNQ